MTVPDKQPNHLMPTPSHRRLVGKLLLIIAFFFAFGFALVPLYDVFCAITGLNGKSIGSDKGVTRSTRNSTGPISRIDSQRIVTIEFTNTVMPGLPWQIEPLTTRLDLHPGELHQTSYRVRNLSDQPITGQAIPSVSPGLAVSNFDKLECFCFRQQTLAPGEAKELPLVFIVKPELDRDVHTITLSYAFFKTSSASPEPSGADDRGSP